MTVGWDGRSERVIGEPSLEPAVGGQARHEAPLFLGDAVEGAGADRGEPLPDGVRVGRAEARAHDPWGRGAIDGGHGPSVDVGPL